MDGGKWRKRWGSGIIQGSEVGVSYQALCRPRAFLLFVIFSGLEQSGLMGGNTGHPGSVLAEPQECFLAGTGGSVAAHPSATEFWKVPRKELKITPSVPFLSLCVKYTHCARLVEQARGQQSTAEDMQEESTASLLPPPLPPPFSSPSSSPLPPQRLSKAHLPPGSLGRALSSLNSSTVATGKALTSKP